MLISAGQTSFYMDDEFVNVDVIELEATRHKIKKGHQRGQAVSKLRMLAYMLNLGDVELPYTKDQISQWIKEALQ